VRAAGRSATMPNGDPLRPRRRYLHVHRRRAGPGRPKRKPRFSRTRNLIAAACSKSVGKSTRCLGTALGSRKCVGPHEVSGHDRRTHTVCESRAASAAKVAHFPDWYRVPSGTTEDIFLARRRTRFLSFSGRKGGITRILPPAKPAAARERSDFAPTLVKSTDLSDLCTCFHNRNRRNVSFN
jgi:hypothetical protein